MTVPAHLRGLPEPVARAIWAAAGEAHRLDPPPPLSPATRAALAVLLRRPAPQRGRAA